MFRQKCFIATSSLLLTFLVLIPGLVSADSLNQRETFFVSQKFDKYSRTQLDATLRLISDKTYFYVEDQYWNGLNTSEKNSLLSSINELGEAFDNDIYDREVALWGSEPNPGVDGDSKITVLLEELKDANGGYFETGNGYSRDRIANSNQREMISINIKAVVESLRSVKFFLAHEFQHMISFNQKELKNDRPEDTWLNELRSEYSVTVAGYNNGYFDSSIERRVSTFIGSPSDSLVEWPNSLIDYGIAAVFAEYLVEQYGRDILSESIKSPLVGIESLNAYLSSRGYVERFANIFMDWMGAVYLNDVSVNTKLGYRGTGLSSLRVQPQQRIYLSPYSSEYKTTHHIKDWQPVWIEYDLSSFSNNKDVSLKVDASGQSGENFIVSYLAFYDSGSVKYGNINFSQGSGTGYILNSSSGLNKLVILATKRTKISGFSDNEFAQALTLKVSGTETGEIKSGLIKDGDLIKRPNEKEIYVVWGKYKRYLVPGVMALYGHLNPANAVEVGPEIFNSYQTSNYVKYINDEKVYAVWPDGTKHWLNITPQQWDATNRDWNAIFTINDLELNYYSLGPNITR